MTNMLRRLVSLGVRRIALQQPQRCSFASKSSDHHSDDSHHDHPLVATTVIPAPVVGPGGKVGEVPTQLEQSTGLERLEYLSSLKDVNLYLTNEVKLDHYGTMEDPIWVESIEDSRIVGCTGFPRNSHPPLWMHIHKGPPQRCPECGQAIALDLVPGLLGHH